MKLLPRLNGFEPHDLANLHLTGQHGGNEAIRALGVSDDTRIIGATLGVDDPNRRGLRDCKCNFHLLAVGYFGFLDVQLFNIHRVVHKRMLQN